MKSSPLLPIVTGGVITTFRSPSLYSVAFTIHWILAAIPPDRTLQVKEAVPPESVTNWQIGAIATSRTGRITISDVHFE